MEKKIEPFLALLVVIAAFFAGKEVFPLSLFYLLAIIIGLYFFPVRLMIRKEESIGNRRSEAEFFIASFTISMIIYASMLVLFVPGQNIFRSLLIAVSLLNIGFFYYNLRSREHYRDALLHMCVILISSAVLFT